MAARCEERVGHTPEHVWIVGCRWVACCEVELLLVLLLVVVCPHCSSGLRLDALAAVCSTECTCVCHADPYHGCVMLCCGVQA
jgi:hypothetical protein